MDTEILNQVFFFSGLTTQSNKEHVDSLFKDLSIEEEKVFN